MPAGSKILVGSYVHLRREGLEGYMDSFNNMVREVFSVTGDIGIEVLPFVPVVFDGIDEIGRGLIGGVQEWIKWIAEKSGRDEIAKLCETGGKENVTDLDATPTFWKPTFVFQHGMKSGVNVLVLRGNVLTMMGDDRKEVVFNKVGPVREIERLRDEKMEGKGRENDDEEGEKERGDFGKGISVEGEFAFTKAVGEFCRSAVRMGRYRGNYRFNLRGQMEQRAWVKEKRLEAKKVVMVGGSQFVRMRDEIVEMGERGVEIERMVRVRGEITDDEVDQALAELAVLETYPDVFVVGGPSNSLMVHGRSDVRGFDPERTVKVQKGGAGQNEKWEVRYHMTTPKRITMVEKRTLVDRVVRLVSGVTELFPETEVVYVTMFPRHVERCCDKNDHMTENDIVVMDNLRRDVDRDIVDTLRDMGKNIRVLEWWDLLGLDNDKTVAEVKKMKLVENDGVHLSARANRCAAVSMCIRMREDENEIEEDRSEAGRYIKKARLL